MQLAGSKFGIAYIDSTEHITQLNRSVDNNLLTQIEYLTTTLYSQLGITTTILDGTASEDVMLNYENRIVVPILSAFVEEMRRKWLTKTARSQKQSVMFFREPFKLVTVTKLAEIADTFTRNEIMSSNEIRQIAGLTPVKSELANELRNKNLNVMEGQEYATTTDLNQDGIPDELQGLEDVNAPYPAEGPIQEDVPPEEEQDTPFLDAIINEYNV